MDWLAAAVAGVTCGGLIDVSREPTDLLAIGTTVHPSAHDRVPYPLSRLGPRFDPLAVDAPVSLG